jgi:hypothetical protein
MADTTLHVISNVSSAAFGLKIGGLTAGQTLFMDENNASGVARIGAYKPHLKCAYCGCRYEGFRTKCDEGCGAPL